MRGNPPGKSGAMRCAGIGPIALRWQTRRAMTAAPRLRCRRSIVGAAKPVSRHRSSVGLRWPSKRSAALHRLPIRSVWAACCASRCAPMAARRLRHLTGDATLAPNRLCRRHCTLDRPMPLHIPSIAVPGRGVLLRDEPSEAACEMLTCLADVLQRLPLSGAPVCLPDEQAQAHREAGQFRQAQPR
ncbi:hypothetical protein [Verminephrobacter eiseniae]|nr:hypothetical protein [Verminephrobacter eiseniae]